MRDVLASVREFGVKVIRRWYAVAVGVIGGVLGIISAVAAAATEPKTTPFGIPLWVWLPLLAGGFLVAIIWAFHDVRMERDAMRAEMKSRFSSMRYALQPSGISGTRVTDSGGAAGAQFKVTLTNHSDEYMRYEVEQVSTAIEGRPGAHGPIGGSNEAIVAPHGTSTITCPPVYDIPADWRHGALKLTVRYGHPSKSRHYRVLGEYALQDMRPPGSPPVQDIQVNMAPVRPVQVEDI